MKRTVFASAMLLVGALVGCDSDQSSNTNKCDKVMCSAGQSCNAATGMCEGSINKCMGVSCSFPQSCDANTGSCANPAPPSLTSAPIDRMGRPGINTVLTNPFDQYRPQGGTTPTESGDTTRDRYNKDGTVTGWTATWVQAIKLNLAILNGLDGGNCSNQLAQTAAGAGMPYSFLAGVLANDALQVDTSKMSCNTYLAVESAALGTSNNECGGRTLSMDVIDTTFAYLVTGGSPPLSDGIAQGTVPLTAFPFLTSPK